MMTGRNEYLYFDYAATTPIDKRVAETMASLIAIDGDFANPSAIHIAGRRSTAHVEQAVDRLATLLNCQMRDLIWTSGATESNNLAIAGAASYRANRGKHLMTMPTEHKAVTDVFRAL